MGQKVTFNYLTKIIEVHEAPVGSPGVVELDVKIDIYSDGKEDWLADPILNKFLFPVTAIGGDPISETKALGSTFFLEYGWKIKPYEASHQLAVNGNLYSRDGSNPYVITDGTYNVQVINQVSNLVDSVQLQLTEIQHSSYDGAVWVDVIAGQAGTAYPIGTPRFPSNNMTDAQVIDEFRGFNIFNIIGDITFGAEVNFDGHTVIGQNVRSTTVTLLAAATLTEAEFQTCSLIGTLDGGAVLRNCVVSDVDFINGVIIQSMINGTVTLSGTANAHFLECYAGTPGPGIPTIDMNGNGQALALRAYSGSIQLVNKTGNDDVSIDLISGHLVLDSTIVLGTIVVRGAGHMTDNSGPNVVVDDRGLTNPTNVAVAVWGHESNIPGSPGLTYGQIVENNASNVSLLNALQISIDAVPQDVWDVDASTVVADSFGEIARRVAFNGVVYIDPNGTAGTTYPTGTLGQPVSNIADAVSIAAAEDIPNLWLLDDITLLATDNVNGYNIEGQNAARASVTVTAGAKTNQTQWKNVKLDGTMNGSAIIRESILENLDNFSGIAFNCLLNPGTITIDPTPPQPVFFLSCYSGVPSANPIIDLDNSGIHLIVRDFAGGFEIQNMDGASIACIDFNSGTLVLDSTVTGGTVIVRGVYGLTDNSTGGTISQNTNLDHIESKIDLVQLDVTDIVAVTTVILKYQSNRTLIDESAFTLTVFDDDKVTPLIVFDLKDETGTASITSIFERIPLGSP